MSKVKTATVDSYRKSPLKNYQSTFSNFEFHSIKSRKYNDFSRVLNMLVVQNKKYRNIKFVFEKKKKVKIKNDVSKTKPTHALDSFEKVNNAEYN